MTSNHSIFSSDLDASTLHCVLDKPSISEDFNFMEHYLNLELTDIENETWVPIRGYEINYQVSSMGRIKTNGLYRNIGVRILKQNLKKNGYIYISLCKNNSYRYFRVHRLVAINFIENTYNKPSVNHKNGIKTDNRVENLEWVTNKENSVHSVLTGLYKSPRHWVGITGSKHPRSVSVHQLNDNGEIVNTFCSALDASKHANAQQQNIIKVCKGKRQKAGGYKWEYA
jgi:hypothetical protein